MLLSPENAQAALALYAWKCAQLEQMLASAQQAIDKLSAENNRLQAIKPPADIPPAPFPAIVDPGTEGGSVD